MQNFVKPLTGVLSPAELDICFPMISALSEMHAKSLSGVRENVAAELCAFVDQAEPIYASHVVALDKAYKMLKDLPPAAKNVVSAA